VHFNLEDQFFNGSYPANLGIASADDFELESVLWKKPCLLLDNSFPVTGAIAKLIASGKLITMAIKLSKTSVCAVDLVPHAIHGKQLFVDSIAGEESSAASAFVMLIEHTGFANLQFDPGGLPLW